MIQRIIFKAGPSPTLPNLSLDVAPITVFVGPNNAGKSRVLIEIEGWSKNGQYPQESIVNQVIFERLSSEELTKELDKIKKPAQSGESRAANYIYLTRPGTALSRNNNELEAAISLSYLIEDAVNGNNNGTNSYAQFRKLFTLRLDGNNRLNLLAQQQAGDFQAPPQNPLARLFRDNKLR